jgi:bifunctional non-homologous end joining protein LigD
VLTPLPAITPIRLTPRAEPFDHLDWLFELQYDGLRSLAYIENGTAKLISRQRETYVSFQSLCAKLARDVKVHDAILDGAIVCLDEKGRPRLARLLDGQREPCYCAFDLLWCNGTDFRSQPLRDRKKALRKVITNRSLSVLCVDYVIERGVSLFRAACTRRLQGIVAKQIDAPYGEGTQWLKIKNPAHTQAEGPEDERR